MRSVFILAGHQVLKGKGTGAVKYLDEAVEADLIAKRVAIELDDHGFKVYTDPPTWTLGQVYKWVKGLIRPQDILVDIHFNAAASEKATGIEVFIPKDYITEELELANSIATSLHQVTGLPLRRGKLIYAGVKTENESQHAQLRMLGGLGVGINVLVEICFVTNKFDAEAFNKHKSLIPFCIANPIKMYV